MTSKRYLLLLLGVLSVAAFVRYWDLNARGVGHIEMYTPNIPLPAGISDPPPRLTLMSTLTGSLWEPHPPAWYLLNWPWTRVFGVSPIALRLPSLIFGVLSVLLVWRFASLERSNRTALVASTLLALNGLHVMWSQISRPVMLVATLGLWSSVVLWRAASTPASRRTVFLYLGLSLAGVATDHYYWFLFGGQAVWVFLASRERSSLRPLLDWQCLTMAVASPLLTLAVAQSRESYLEARVIKTALNYLGFGFLFGPGDSSYTPASWIPLAAILAGIVLALIGIWRGRTPPSPGHASITRPAPALTWTILIAATIVVTASAFVLSMAGLGTFARLLPTAIMPAVFLFAMWLSNRAPSNWLPAAPPLSVVLCAVPVVVIFAISLAMPLVDAKYFLLFTPFLLIVMAEGLVWLWSTAANGSLRFAAAGVVAVAVIAHAASLELYRNIDATPIDFRGLVSQLRPELADSDKVLVYKHYAMTPVFYYLRLDASRYVGNEHAAVRAEGVSRFWLISLRDTGIDDPPGYAEATKGCELAGTITALRIRAERYERCLNR